jgi:hypothetical protein
MAQLSIKMAATEKSIKSIEDCAQLAEQLGQSYRALTTIAAVTLDNLEKLKTAMAGLHIEIKEAD